MLPSLERVDLRGRKSGGISRAVIEKLPARFGEGLLVDDAKTATKSKRGAKQRPK